MAVAFDAKCGAPGTSTGAPPPIDFATFINVGAGSNRVLIVGLAFSNGISTPLPGLAVTWDQGGTNQAMTQIVGASAGQTATQVTWVTLFGLVAPTSGSKTLRVTWGGGNQNFTVMAVSFTGADQTGGTVTFPNGTGNSNSGTASNPATVTVTSSVNNAIVAIHGDNNSQVVNSTSDSNIVLSNGGAPDTGANYAIGSGTHALTATYAAAVNWASAGTDIAAFVAAGAAVPPTIFGGFGNVVRNFRMLDFGVASRIGRDK